MNLPILLGMGKIITLYLLKKYFCNNEHKIMSLRIWECLSVFYVQKRKLQNVDCFVTFVKKLALFVEEE